MAESETQASPEAPARATTPPGGDSAAQLLSDELPAVTSAELPPDELPADLQPAMTLAEYAIPNNSRRRVVGALYGFIGVVFAATWLVARSSDTALLNVGFLAAGIALLALGAHHILTGRELQVDDTEALKLATAAVPFAVGHASAQMGWRGWLSRPTWKVLLYSNEDQPTQRALVRLDGLTGAVVDQLAEDNPEDWTELLKSADSSADSTAGASKGSPADASQDPLAASQDV